MYKNQKVEKSRSDARCSDKQRALQQEVIYHTENLRFKSLIYSKKIVQGTKAFIKRFIKIFNISIPEVKTKKLIDIFLKVCLE